MVVVVVVVVVTFCIFTTIQLGFRVDSDWVKKCIEYAVEAARPRGRPKKTGREIVEKDCQARKLNREDTMDHDRCRKQIRDD